jgi:EmrB/QacA subfamily drug resistance transporter
MTGNQVLPSEQAGAGSYRLVALIIASAFFMEFVDATVLATALPTMARDFGMRAPEMSLALTSYLLALAIFIPASGWLADRFGGRSIFCSAILLFMFGSLACSQTSTLAMLVAARFIQGVGGAMMVPVGRLIVLRSVPKSDLVSAMAWLLIPAMVGPIVGPPLGGLIVTYLDWRWIFYINLPVCVIGLLLAWRFIANVREERPGNFDAPGFVLSGLSLGCLLIGFEMVSRPGEGGLAALLVAAGLIAGLIYVRHAKRRENPLLDLSLMRDETFRLAVIAGTLIRIGQGAQPFLMPLMMQQGFGFSAARSGTITVATAIGALMMRGFIKPLLRRFGYRRALTVNGLVTTAGYAACGFFTPGWPVWAMFAVLCMTGFFLSLQFTAYNTVAYDGIETNRMSRATAFYLTFQQLSLSFGVCLGAVALNLVMSARGHAAPAPADFSVALWTVAAVAVTSAFWNIRFAPHAGADISGHVSPTALAESRRSAVD